MHQGGYIHEVACMTGGFVSPLRFSCIHSIFRLKVFQVWRSVRKQAAHDLAVSCIVWGHINAGKICWKGWLAQDRTSRAVFEKFSSHLGPCCGVRQCLLNFKVSRPGNGMHLSMIFGLFLEWFGTSGLLCVAVDPCEHAPHLSKAFAKRCLLRFVNWRAAAPSAAASSKSNGLYFQGDQSSQTVWFGFHRILQFGSNSWSNSSTIQIDLGS